MEDQVTWQEFLEKALTVEDRAYLERFANYRVTDMTEDRWEALERVFYGLDSFEAS